MGTSAYIARKTEQGNFIAAYVNYDGYVDGVGSTLVEHYNDDAKVKALLEFSEMSALKADINEIGAGKYEYASKEHSADTVYSSTDALLQAIEDNCINYLYVWDGSWKYAKLELGDETTDYSAKATALFDLV